MDFETITDVARVKELLGSQGFAIGRVNPTAYHEWKDKLGHCVSKSSLVDFMDCPYVFDYKRRHKLRKESTAMRWGSLVDCLALTPELTDKMYSCEKVNRRTNEGKARVAELAASGVVISTPDEMNDARDAATMMQGMLDDLSGSDGYVSQVGMWVQLESIGDVKLAVPVILTGLVDAWALSGERLIDAKTTSADVNVPAKLIRTIADFSYGIQAAIYIDLARVCTGLDFDFYFAFQSSEKPFVGRVVSMQPMDVCLYRSRYQSGVIAYAQCCASGDWGSPQLPDMVYVPPMWELNKELAL